MINVSAFWRSTIGKKVVMAITGIIGIGYLLVHMTGNLLAFRGGETLNHYGALLKGNVPLLWTARVVLIVAVILHVISAWQLTRRSHAARPVGYNKKVPQVSTLASRTMRWGGVLLLVFIVFHILHFTTGDIRPAGYFEHTDIYGNVVKSFQVLWVSLFYIIAMIFVGLHLYHGVWSSVKSLGVAPQSENPLKRKVALALAIIIWAGFTSIPLAVLAGWLR